MFAHSKKFSFFLVFSVFVFSIAPAQCANTQDVRKFLAVPVKGYGPIVAAVAAGALTEGTIFGLLKRNADVAAGGVILGFVSSAISLALLKCVPNNIFAQGTAVFAPAVLIGIFVGEHNVDKLGLPVLLSCSSLAAVATLNYFNT